MGYWDFVFPAAILLLVVAARVPELLGPAAPAHAPLQLLGASSGRPRHDTWSSSNARGCFFLEAIAARNRNLLLVVLRSILSTNSTEESKPFRAPDVGSRGCRIKPHDLWLDYLLSVVERKSLGRRTPGASVRACIVGQGGDKASLVASAGVCAWTGSCCDIRSAGTTTTTRTR